MVFQATPDQPLHSFTSFPSTWSTRRQRSRRRLPRKDNAAARRRCYNFPPFSAKREETHTKLSSPGLSASGSDAIPNSRPLRLRIKCGDKDFSNKTVLKEPNNVNEEEAKREEETRQVSKMKKKKKKNGEEKEAETTKRRSKFSLALTRDEIEKDIMAMMKSSSSASILGMRNKAHKRCKTSTKYLDKIVPGFGTLHGTR